MEYKSQVRKNLGHAKKLLISIFVGGDKGVPAAALIPAHLFSFRPSCRGRASLQTSMLSARLIAMTPWSLWLSSSTRTMSPCGSWLFSVPTQHSEWQWVSASSPAWGLCGALPSHAALRCEDRSLVLTFTHRSLDLLPESPLPLFPFYVYVNTLNHIIVEKERFQKQLEMEFLLRRDLNIGLKVNVMSLELNSILCLIMNSSPLNINSFLLTRLPERGKHKRNFFYYLPCGE